MASSERFVSLSLLLLCSWSVCVSHEDGLKYYFNLDGPVGRTFDGLGAISGGGTSAMLLDYPEKQRVEILDYLFKPNFGASLQILKVEIGGDAQSGDGTEPSHMHESWDENYERGYEWWLMTEAKKRNPNITLYALPYGFPGWLGVNGSTDPPAHPEVTADYIARWVHCAWTHHNLSIDFVGVWNGRNMSTDYVKVLRKTLDSRGHSHTHIVAPDMPWSESTIVTDLHNDPDYAAAVSTIGIHFPGTSAPESASKLGKQLWASSDFSTFNDDTGGGCLARIINRNYVEGNYTATIAQNLVTSFYTPLPAYRHGLMTAAEPWTGHYTVDTPAWVLAHTTQFVRPGWTYLVHGSGVGTLQGGGSYVSFLSPDKRDLTIVIETMSHKHSVCNGSPVPDYTVVPQNMSIQLVAGQAGMLWQMNTWYTKLHFNGTPSYVFQALRPTPVQHGQIFLTLGVDEIYTLSTLFDVGQRGFHPVPPPSKTFPTDYSDDFEGVPVGQKPRYLLQQSGVFRVAQSRNEDATQVLRQVMLHPPVSVCSGGSVGKTLTLVGDSQWDDFYAQISYHLGTVNGTDGVFMAVRMRHSGCDTSQAEGIFFCVYPGNMSFAVYHDLAATKLIAKGQLPSSVSGDWNTMAMLAKGPRVMGSVDTNILFNVTVPHTAQDTGFVALGTTSYGIADFDNLIISAAADHDSVLSQ